MLHLLCHQDALAFSSNYTVASRGYQEIPWTLTAASVMTLGPETLTIYLELSWWPNFSSPALYSHLSFILCSLPLSLPTVGPSLADLSNCFCCCLLLWLQVQLLLLKRQLLVLFHHCCCLCGYLMPVLRLCLFCMCLAASLSCCFHSSPCQLLGSAFSSSFIKWLLHCCYGSGCQLLGCCLCHSATSLISADF